MEKYNGEQLQNAVDYLAKQQRSLTDVGAYLEARLKDIQKVTAETTHDDECDAYYTELNRDVRLALVELSEARASLNNASNALKWAVQHAG